MSAHLSSAPLHLTRSLPETPPLLLPRPHSAPRPNPPLTPSLISSLIPPPVFRDSSRSIPACSHHPRDTRAPGRRVARLYRSRIGCVAIYYATVFCLRVMDFCIPTVHLYLYRFRWEWRSMLSQREATAVEG